MSTHEIPQYSMEGKPGLVVDEGYMAKEKRSFLDVCIYNNEGEIIFYTDYERSAGPSEIAGDLKFFANELIKSPPSTMFLEDAMKIYEIMVREAEKLLEDEA